MSREHELMELLYAAFHSQHGIAVSTNSPERLRQRLYALRRTLEDEALSSLSFTTSPMNPAGELWIVKK